MGEEAASGTKIHRADHDPDRDILTFDNPPVSEVVFGVGFGPTPGLNIAELGRYWGQVSDRFPNSSLNAPIPPPGIPFMMEMPPRLMLQSSDGTKLLQLQDNWLLLNWIKRSGSYPRFGTVFSSFTEELGEFINYLDSRNLARPVITQCRLNYVNHIPRGQGWSSLGDVNRVVPDFLAAWSTHREMPVPKAMACNLVFDLPVGRLDIAVRNGLAQGAAEEILVLDIGVSSVVGPLPVSNLDDWFTRARELIVRSFKDMTSAEAHDMWGLHA